MNHSHFLRGRLEDDNIQYGYHGMTFNLEGQYVRIPGQESIQRSAAVRTLPVQKKRDCLDLDGTS